MDFLSLFFEQSIIDDFLGQWMFEHVFQIRLNGSRSDKIESFQGI